MFPSRTRLTTAFLLAISLAFVLLGLLWLLQPSLTTRAQSQPEALGSLSGTVRNAQGQPLANITVWLEHYQGQYQALKTTSDGNGLYSFPAVFSGAYLLRFEDPQNAYATQYYQTAHFREDANTVTVNGNHVSGIEMTMQQAGSILLTVQSSGVITESRYLATLYRQTANGRWSVFRYATPTPGEQSIVISQLPTGAYRLCIGGDSYYYYPTAVECYDNVLPESVLQLAPGASDIVVQAGAQTELTIILNDISQVKGYVTGPEGQPLADVVAQAVALIGYPVQIARSDETGFFRFGYLPTGSYHLIFTPNFNGPSEYLAVYYPGHFSGVSAPAVSIGPSTRMSITQQLTREARIVGKVSLPGGGSPGYATINLMRQTPNGSWDPFWCYDICPIPYFNVETGVFSMTQVAAGTYRVRAEVYLPSGQNFLIGYYGGNSPETAADIVMAAGDTKENIDIIVGATDFDSAISGKVTANGAPLAGIEVGLFPQYWDSSSSAMPLFSTVTDVDGRYRLEGLAIGYYQVAARDPQGIYATTFYTGSGIYFPPNTVAVTQTGTLPNINLALTPGGTIRGHVRTQVPRLPGDYIIQVLPKLADPYAMQVMPYSNVLSAADGSFEVTGLPPGEYYLRALTPSGSGDYANRLAYYHPAAAEPFSAQVLAVEAGKTLQDKDIFFFFTPTTYLPRIGGGTATGELPYPIPAPGFPLPLPPNPIPIPTATPAFP